MTNAQHLAGLKIVLTGDFDAHERDDATRLLEALGADVTGSVSGKTQAVVVGKDPGATKLDGAKKRGLPLLTEADMLALLAGKTLADVIGAPAAAATAPPTSHAPAAAAAAPPTLPAAVVVAPTAPTGKPLAGAKLVLTGDFQAHDRAAATKRLEALGADVTGSVSGKTHAVIVGSDAGETKLAAARERGLPLLDESHLLALLAGTPLADVLAGSLASASPAAPASGPVAASVPPWPPRPSTMRDGEYVERFPGNDVVFVRGTLVDGLKHGTWTKHHKNGKPAEERTWARAEIHGPARTWHDNGALASEGAYQNGKRVGPWKTWSPTGVLLVDETCDDEGWPVGMQRRWNEDGSLLSEGEHLDHQKHGRWTWTSDGDKVEMHYFRGDAHGRELVWYPNGTLRRQRSWWRGKLDGECAEWHPDGKPAGKGQFVRGAGVGEHVSWDDKGTQTVTRFVGGFPEGDLADEKKRAKVLKGIAKAKDHYAKREVLDGAFGRENAAEYLAHLWRAGAVDVAKDSDLWDTFEEAHFFLSGEDVLTFLRAVPAKEDRYGEVLPEWRRELDRLVMQVYARDPAPFDAAQDTLPAAVRDGVAWVRLRHGIDIGARLHGRIEQLARKHVTSSGIGDAYFPDGTFGVVQHALFDRAGHATKEGELLVAALGGTEAWQRALLAQALAVARAKDDLKLRRVATAVSSATPEEVAVLLGAVGSYADPLEVIPAALGTWRRDPLVTTASIALAVDPDREDARRLAVAAAIVLHGDAGQPVPAALVDALSLRGKSPTDAGDWHREPLRKAGVDDTPTPALRWALVDKARGSATPTLALLRRALAALTDEQRAMLFERTLEDPYARRHAALLASYTPAFAWDRVFEGDDGKYADYAVMYELGELGARALPIIETRAANAKTKEQRQGLDAARLVALARILVDGGDFSPEHDAAVKQGVGAPYYEDTFLPFVERILWTLPPARSEAILLSQLASKHFARAFRLISCNPSPAVLESAFTTLLARHKKLTSEERSDVAIGVVSLPNAAAWTRWLLAAGVTTLRDQLARTIGWQVFEELEAELARAGSATPAADHAETLRLLAVDALGKKKGERIYALRKLPEGTERADVNVIGGAAPGVEAARWPRREDEPMTHLFTVDVRTMPELAKRVGKGVRSVSLFVASPDLNEAYAPGNDWTAVVTSTDAQVTAAVTPPEEATLRELRRFEPVGIDVPDAIWSDDSGDDDDDGYGDEEEDDREADGDVKQLRTEVYRTSARVLGEPIWLQSDEAGGGAFLLQFDGSFVDVNLGDGGVMYVFGDTAFWQCH